MDWSREEGLGSNVRCIPSSTARSLQSVERAGRLLGKDVVRGNLEFSKAALVLEQDTDLSCHGQWRRGCAWMSAHSGSGDLRRLMISVLDKRGDKEKGLMRD